jgi:hypothetical protein
MPNTKPPKVWWHQYIKSRARQIFQWSSARKACKERATGGQDLSGIYYHICEECGKKPLYSKQYQVDHIDSCENVGTWDGWDNWLKRTLDVSVEGLKLLCLDCHRKKSNHDNNLRRKARK